LVERVKASVFHKFMRSGRTSPMLTTCVTKEDTDVDVVVKLNGAMELGKRAATFELVGSMMASKMGIECPRPYLVWLGPEFIDAVIQRAPSKEQHLRDSQGWNFGSPRSK
jgi:hypothetical protein